MFFVQSGQNEKIPKGPCINASCKILFCFAEQFQRKRFLYVSANQKHYLSYGRQAFNPIWKKWEIFFNRPYINASCKILFYFAKQLQIGIFFLYLSRSLGRWAKNYFFFHDSHISSPLEMKLEKFFKETLRDAANLV